MKTLNRILAEWKQIAKHIGDFQSRLILTLFYFIIFMPFALIARLAGFFKPCGCGNNSAWEDRQKDDATISAAARQF
jgi:hypothetical protein